MIAAGLHGTIELIGIIQRDIHIDGIVVSLCIRNRSLGIKIRCAGTLGIIQRIFILGIVGFQPIFDLTKVGFPGRNMILRVLAIPSGQTVVGLLVLSALTGITAIAGRDGVGSFIILALAIVVRGSVADQNQILAVGVHLGVGRPAWPCRPAVRHSGSCRR